MLVSADPERETAVDDMIYPVNGALERAGGEERVVGRVKSYGPKLLPIPHVRIFC